MNINRFLCKHFDVDKKGYVTIEDFVAKTVFCFILLVAISFVVYAFYRGVLFIQNNHINDGGNDMFGFFGVLAIALLIVIIISSVWFKISQIRIAKCELKNKEE